MYQSILHPELLLNIPVSGEKIAAHLAMRVAALAVESSTLTDPAVSVVIRSRNNGPQLESLLQDINKQDYDNEVEVIVVDTESTDSAIGVAKAYGAAIVPISQAEFSYPMALNRGFAAANHNWVLSLVDHSRLSNYRVLKTATIAEARKDIAGISGLVFPNTNASTFENAFTASAAPSRVAKAPYEHTKAGIGFLAANASIFSKAVWSEIGGFDESYGAGGEDGAYAKSSFELGYAVLVDPAMSVHHSHGLGPINSMRQLQYWSRLGKPAEFSAVALAKFRSDM